MKLLEVHQVIKTENRTFYVNCVFNLPVIISHGFIPDDVIPMTIGKCIAAYLAIEKSRAKHID